MEHKSQATSTTRFYVNSACLGGAVPIEECTAGVLLYRELVILEFLWSRHLLNSVNIIIITALVRRQDMAIEAWKSKRCSITCKSPIVFIKLLVWELEKDLRNTF